MPERVLCAGTVLFSSLSSSLGEFSQIWFFSITLVSYFFSSFTRDVSYTGIRVAFREESPLQQSCLPSQLMDESLSSVNRT